MISVDEAWAHYDRTTKPCDGQKASYGLDELDLKLVAAIDSEAPGIFVEVGAHDGVSQSNSILLEQRGWTGVLIEANPASFSRCVKSRPGAIVEHAALVAADFEGSHVALTDVGLMSLTTRSMVTGGARESWIDRGERFAQRPRQDIQVPAATLSSILNRHGIQKLDLLLLDVEGAEIDVLKGLDFTRHAPRFILAEDPYTDDVAEYLRARGFTRSTVLLERQFTRDCLYRKV